MRTIDLFHNRDDEFVHPLWLGMLILFSVLTIIGTFCCLRIKCGPQIRHLFNTLFGRNNETNGKKDLFDMCLITEIRTIREKCFFLY